MARGGQRIGVAVIAVALAVGSTRVPSAAAQPQRSPAQAAELATAARLTTEGIEAYQRGEYEQAKSLLARVVVMRAEALGPDDVGVAVALANLARPYASLGEYARAKELLLRALDIEVRALGPDDPRLADEMNDLATVYVRQGSYAHAEALCRRAIELQEKRYGPEHPYVATSLGNLATIYLDGGDWARAEPLYRRALEIDEKALGPDDAEVATDLNNLALLYGYEGDYAHAEPLLVRALAIDEKALGPRAAAVATALQNLAKVYVDTGEFARAEPLLLRALDIDEKALGKDHPAVARDANDLAYLYEEMGDRTRPLALYLRALSIREHALGPDHPDVALSLNNLGLYLWHAGDPARAAAFLTRAHAAYAAAFGDDHPDVATTLVNLAEIALSTGDTTRALAYLSRGLDARERHVARVVATGSEEQRRLFLETSKYETDAAISLHAQASMASAEARALALLAVLRRKGRLLDVMTDTYATLRAHLTPDDAAMLEQLRDLSATLAQRTISGPPSGKSAEEERKALEDLGERAAALEARLAARSAEFRVAATPVTLDEVRRAIPSDAALVEIAAYTPFDGHGDTPAARWSAPPRYAAYALRSTGEIAYADLGEARRVDDLVARLRGALSDPSRDPRPDARALDEAVGRPLREIVGDVRHVLLAPDGALDLVPFGALVDEHGDFLVRRYFITYLTTGRDLLRIAARGSPATSATSATSAPVVVASPEFGRAAPAPAGSGGGGGGALMHAFFPELPGTADEGRAVAALLPGAVDLQGAAATKTAVSALRSPSLLHIATHGFFLDDRSAAPPRDDRGLTLDTGGAPPPPPLENPLLRSGLAFAGANFHDSHDGHDDGLMTALEASALDLWGTKLVVLSACETGVGEVKNGEGVYGLRRALVLAGAASEVMSLWKVDDAATRDLMVAYYTALKSGGGRTEALREAQLAMLDTKERGHPYYWASFIPSGDWRSLDGAEVPTRGGAATAEDALRVHHGACGCEAVGQRRDEADAYGAAYRAVGGEPAWAAVFGLVLAARRRLKGAKPCATRGTPPDPRARPASACWRRTACCARRSRCG